MPSTLVLLKVLVAALANFLLGVLWYSPLLFGPEHSKLMKKHKMKMKVDPVAAHATTFLAILLTTYALAILVRVSGASGSTDGAIIGLAVGLAFVATTLLSEALYSGQPSVLFFINASYRVVGLALSGAILASLI
jgi:hypothetical protein